jgi:hypothetical protein
MKFAVEIGSGAMKYISGSIRIGSGNQKLVRRIHTQTYRQKDR